MFVDPHLAPSPDAPARAQPAGAPIMAEVCTRHWLRLLPGAALCEAEVVRQLARDGIAVLRRAWGPADTQGGAPVLLLLTAPVPDAVAARAAERLQQRTGATVHRLRVEWLEEPPAIPSLEEIA